MDYPAFCQALPKVELHAHLNGSMSVATMGHLRDQKLARYPELRDMPLPKGPQENVPISDFFPLFQNIYRLTDDEASVRWATRSVLQDFAQDNVRYLELRTTPRHVPETGMTTRSYVEAVLQALDEWHAETATPDNHMQVRLILSIDRRSTLDTAMATVDLAATLGSRGVVGVDLCGNPSAGSFAAFAPAFERAHQAGLKITVHMGEVPANIPEGLDALALNPHRVGHATVLDAATRQALLGRQIPVEVCLTSNVQCQTVPSYDDHFVKDFARNNHPFIPCTDDKGVFMCSLSQEYERLGRMLALSPQALFALSRQCIDYIFDPDSATKARLRAQWDAWRINHLDSIEAIAA
ncbi:hypothetical protein H4R35_000999 [Dimargaris xerosporica]|nr:hypothetical protein H4R35_000999 [Dimargaris xerosporica]